MTLAKPHQFIISLGSNHKATEHIPNALAVLRRELYISKESPLMQTEPVDFPYASPKFSNIILWGHCSQAFTELQQLLRTLERLAGRDRGTPHLVPLDADLIVWDSQVLKPQDLERPYFKPYLESEQ